LNQTPIIVRSFVGWAIVAIAARWLTGGAAPVIAVSCAVALVWTAVVFLAMTRNHAAVGRRLDQGVLRNEEFVRHVALGDLRWSLPALALAFIGAAFDSPLWLLTLAAPLLIFVALSLFIAVSERPLRRGRT
jgi:hypothetical protein